jgi:CRP-like cAMP-binding protein
MDEAVYGDIQRMAVLKSIDLFSELEIESLYQILKVAKYVKFAKDEMIVSKGELGESFYVILEGKAAVLVDLSKEMITTISRGGIVGELSILDKQERTAWVRALEETLVLEFDGEAFVSLIKTNNAIAFSMARTLSQRLRNTLRTRRNIC